MNLGTSRLSVSTPLSPIKESRKETESLLDFNASPIRENKLQLAAVPKKQSSRIRLNLKQTIVDEKWFKLFFYRCAEKILTQLEYDTLKTNTVDIQVGFEIKFTTSLSIQIVCKAKGWINILVFT